MPTWYFILAGILLLLAAYFLVYPQSVVYAILVGLIGIYALALGFGISTRIGNPKKKK